MANRTQALPRSTLAGRRPDESAIPLVLLLLLFGGDADAWARFLREEGSPAQLRDDLPLALSLARRCDGDARFRAALRTAAASLRQG